MKLLINYANSAYRASQKLNTQTGLDTAGFDDAISYSPEDIDASFREKNKKILDRRRGNGYWLWKPYIIHHALRSLAYEDILFYSDSAAHFIGRIDPVLDLCHQTRQDVIPFELQHTERCWTKRDAFLLTGTDSPEYVESRQRLASFSVWRKSTFALDFVRELLEFCEDERIITDADNTLGAPNYPGFRAHRHDQSVFSLLTKLHGLRAFRDPSQWGNDCKERYPESTYGQVIQHTRQRNLSLASIPGLWRASVRAMRARW
jgi:hypothetical protein